MTLHRSMRLMGAMATAVAVATVTTIAASPAEAATAPGPPTSVSAGPGDGQAYVAWTAPTNTGGAPLASYTIQDIGQPDHPLTTIPAVLDGSATHATVTGLTNDSIYMLSVKVTNAAGLSTVSETFAQVTPEPGPGVPTDVHAVVTGRGEITVTFTPPVDDGGSPVTAYIARATASSGEVFFNSGEGSPLVVGGLPDATTFTVTVVALNKNGESKLGSAANTYVTPRVPAAPTALTAVALSGSSARLSWTPPAGDPGDPIVSYTVYGLDPPRTVPAGTSAVIDGLSGNATYTFSLIANNDVGSSPMSGPADPVRIPAAPSHPYVLDVVPGDGELQITIGHPILGDAPLTYVVSATPIVGPPVSLVDLYGDPSRDIVVLRGLRNGMPYVVSVMASNPFGVSDPSPPVPVATAVPEPQATVAVTAPLVPILANRQIAVRGRIGAPDGTVPRGLSSITVRAHEAGTSPGSTRVVGTAAVSADGSFSFPFTPVHTTTLTFACTATDAEGSYTPSTPARVFAVTASLGKLKATRSKGALSVSGVVTPGQEVKVNGSYGVVELWQTTGSGHLVRRLQSAPIGRSRASAETSRGVSMFSLRKTTALKGPLHLEVILRSAAQNAPTHSTVIMLR